MYWILFFILILCPVIYGDSVYVQPKLREEPSLIRRGVPDFWHQEIPLTPVPERKVFLTSYSTNKAVLHVGCVDWPVFDPNNNLHLTIASVTDTLDCLDPDIKGLHELKQHYTKGFYFPSTKVIPRNRTYELVIVPEVIEHVTNIQLFLASLDEINFHEIIITGPFPRPDLFVQHSETLYTETVHPDHKIWVSPYTLVNMVEQYTDWTLANVYLWKETASCGVRFIKPTNASTGRIQELREKLANIN